MCKTRIKTHYYEHINDTAEPTASNETRSETESAPPLFGRNRFSERLCKPIYRPLCDRSNHAVFDDSTSRCTESGVVIQLKLCVPAEQQ
ncbi:hypothetical protein TSAR_013629 [Trichomalopsis sarcophagae]|uniref:Uncharacterized protein n=1 Tax=Trichomalopsis sarcophagae TaxID=543379 RepID=A0A232F8S7_9HYME|nr:hypothetical protein TSAR_013629 [Trichomalopsis sarcophagae]